MLVSLTHLAFDVFDPATTLTMHSKQSPTDAEIAPVLPAIAEQARRHQRVRSLVFTDGGAPTLAQRKRTIELVGDRNFVVRNAVVSDATSVRFVISAIALVSEAIQSFSCSDFSSALEFLEYSADERAVVVAKLKAIAKNVPSGRFSAFDRVVASLGVVR
ncbi:MAG: hypothetical protein JNK05_02075 [Myxococcales bacterium]|nr:hypothetical protein [Myxococcales bacterium]